MDLPQIDKWKRLIDVQFWPQKELSQVIRWAEMTEAVGELIVQDVQGHTLALLPLVIEFTRLLQPYNPDRFDLALLMAAIYVHDFPEAITGDIAVPNHSEIEDVQESATMIELMQKFPHNSYELYYDAFHLQFVTKSAVPESFSTKSCDTIKRLSATKQTQALLFRAVEEMDHLFYGMACLDIGQPLVLAEAFYSQYHRYQMLAKDLPGFKEEIWTDDLRLELMDFYLQHEDNHRIFRQNTGRIYVRPDKYF